MGGSFVPGIGGHNPLEPARIGRPILTGPHAFNAADVSTSGFDVQTSYDFVAGGVQVQAGFAGSYVIVRRAVAPLRLVADCLLTGGRRTVEPAAN